MPTRLPKTFAAGYPDTFCACLERAGARGKRIAVLRQAFPDAETDLYIAALMQRALADLRHLDLTVIDLFVISEFDTVVPRPHPASEVRATIEQNMVTTGPGFSRTVAEIVAAGNFHSLHGCTFGRWRTHRRRLTTMCAYAGGTERRMRAAYLAAMDDYRVDALVVPVAATRLIGDRNVTSAG